MSLKHIAMINLIAVAGMCGGSQVRAEDGVAQKAGEAVDNVVRGIQKGVASASQTVQEQWARARTSVHNMEIESRVYSRLHWEKMLTDAPLELEIRAGGVVVLYGSVTDAVAKKKALELANDTVGVTKVIDQVSIVIAGSAVPPATRTPVPTSTPVVPTR